ncbi:MAG: tRNA (adenosine(37)-N6)-threonylcarbamoyltransferase complex transferase subunit TsaD [Coprothermobacterota bacterium]|nr:tRNA (adenosine(37)-N6)-threonylcarbamoyltransferase complex transferase subunit TsaD [Coprothermobacterota bacterium]
MLILGIESSCDETAVALWGEEEREVISLVSSQVDLHTRYGGVVPELASRRHLEVLVPLLEEALIQAGCSLSDVGAVAVTQGPGLVGALLVGMESAKAISLAGSLPLLGVNHLAGHVYAAFLEHPTTLPALALIVSGGHTELVLLDQKERFTSLGSTRDDAAGETLDKVARFIGLPYPGGPQVQKQAESGNRAYHHFPVGEMDNPLDFSFSGLKTAVITFVEKSRAGGVEPPLADLCASFQEAVVEALVSKTQRALRVTQARNLIVCGGVAANRRLRERMAELAMAKGVNLFIPSTRLCTDNALMISRAGWSLYLQGRTIGLSDDVDPNLSLFDA